MAKSLASVKLFKGIWHFCSYWDGIVKECLSTDNEYSQQIKRMREGVVQRIKNGHQESWYGDPVPKSIEDAMDRRTYQKLELYETTYLKIEPFLQFLEKISTGLIPKPVIVPNDKQLGSFSLERAMMSPTKSLCLWSNKHKREYTISEGTQTSQIVKVKLNNEYVGKKDEEEECSVFKLKDGSDAYLTQKLARQLCLWSDIHKKEFDKAEGDPVLDDDKNPLYVKIKLNNEGKKDEHQCAVYKLKNDGTEAYLTDKVVDGKLSPVVLSWSSLNKKSFLYQEKLPKPNSNIRLFVLVGGNCGRTELYWSGMVAIMAAKFLSTKGYSVRVTGVIATRANQPMRFSWVDDNGTKHDNELYKDGPGYRVNLIDMKSYEEEIDSLGLLYPLADASFFRIRCFDYFTAEYWLFKDKCDPTLGVSPNTNEVETIVRDKIKSREIEQEKDVLYYFIGGDNVTSLEGAEMNLAKIIYCAEKNNRESLIKLGYAFEELEPNVREDFERMVIKYNLGNIKCNQPD